MLITEISTVVTDMILGLACVAMGGRLHHLGRGVRSPIGLWAASFLFTGIAAFLGAAYHGTLNIVGVEWGSFLWRGTMVSAGLANFFMVIGTGRAVLTGTSRLLLSGAAIFKFVVYVVLVLVLRRDDFALVVADYVPALLVVAALQWKNRWILFGVVLTLVAAALQQSGVGLSDFLNQNDLFHLFQTLAMFGFYRGVRQLSRTV